MQISIVLNGKKIQEEIEPDLLLIDFVRKHGCKSVKRGCETSGCGLCTVFLDDKPVLSCSILAARVDGHKVTTLEGLKEEAEEFGASHGYDCFRQLRLQFSSRNQSASARLHLPSSRQRLSGSYEGG